MNIILKNLGFQVIFVNYIWDTWYNPFVINDINMAIQLKGGMYNKEIPRNF